MPGLYNGVVARAVPMRLCACVPHIAPSGWPACSRACNRPINGSVTSAEARLVRGIDRVDAGWWAGRMAGLVAFVGREAELSRLLGALAGDTWLVLVTGDAGVGKTRFAGEGMARAGAGGMVAVRGE